MAIKSPHIKGGVTYFRHVTSVQIHYVSVFILHTPIILGVKGDDNPPDTNLSAKLWGITFCVSPQIKILTSNSCHHTMHSSFSQHDVTKSMMSCPDLKCHHPCTDTLHHISGILQKHNPTQFFLRGDTALAILFHLGNYTL